MEAVIEDLELAGIDTSDIMCWCTYNNGQIPCPNKAHFRLWLKCHGCEKSGNSFLCTEDLQILKEGDRSRCAECRVIGKFTWKER